MRVFFSSSRTQQLTKEQGFMGKTILGKASRLIMGVIFLLLASCSPAAPAAPAPDAAQLQTQVFLSALLTATYGVPTATFTPAPTHTPTPIPPTATPIRTPPALPPVFTTGLLNKLDTPHTYVKETCQYLKDRWDPNKSEPGTVVMPIMFHAITEDGEVTGNQVSTEFFNGLMRDLKMQGFQTITTAQLADFLETNAKIPKRSMILIVDDRHYAEYFEDHFLPYLKENQGTVTNAWISNPLVSSPDLIRSMAGLIDAGWIDVQAHGVIHNTPIDNSSSEDFIHSELFGSIDWIQKNFGKTPIAYIWPGGNFTKRGVEVARDAGYRLGFTVNPRGPLMFNWIPLDDAADPGRPSFFAEGPMGDPLMVLPRYWDTDASYHIDSVRQISKEAEAYAQQNKQTELDYYDIICKPLTGEIGK
jgi:peptidoglycan/xylan/chitin deacetylase (PgdA/CDA1 family)